VIINNGVNYIYYINTVNEGEVDHTGGGIEV
jgi:hypothetical protein